jgi:hypothetical protein
MFKLARTFDDPGSRVNSNRGFPAPGSGAQQTGDYTLSSIYMGDQSQEPVRPTKGRRALFTPAQASQRGAPPPNAPDMRRPAGSFDQNPAGYQPDGLNHPHYTREFSRGAPGVVQEYGKVLVNPIGSGVVVRHRPQASYGPAAQYVNGSIWWTTQAVPTSVNLQGLTDPRVLEQVLGPIMVQAAIRVG